MLEDKMVFKDLNICKLVNQIKRFCFHIHVR